MLRSDEPQPTSGPKVIYQSDPRDAQLIASLEKTIARSDEVIEALKRELKECRDGAHKPAEKGFRPQHLGGAQFVDIHTSKRTRL